MQSIGNLTEGESEAVLSSFSRNIESPGGGELNSTILFKCYAPMTRKHTQQKPNIRSPKLSTLKLHIVAHEPSSFNPVRICTCCCLTTKTMTALSQVKKRSPGRSPKQWCPLRESRTNARGAWSVEAPEADHATATKKERPLSQKRRKHREVCP